MKKVFLAAIFISISVFLTSCGSTNVPTQPEKADDRLNQKQEEVANEIAEQINAASPKSEEEAVEGPSEEESSTEEVTPEKSDNETEEENSVIQKEPEVEVSAEKSDSDEKTDGKSDSEEADKKTGEKSASDEKLGGMTGIAFVSTAPSKAKATIIDNNKKPSESKANTVSDSSTKENAEQSNETDSKNNANSDSEENSSSENKSDSQNNTEKVSVEDSNLEKDGGEAPTTDEKNKVSEYKILEEPDVKVKDLPKTEPKPEVKTAPAPQADKAAIAAAALPAVPKNTKKSEKTEKAEPKEQAQAAPAPVETAAPTEDDEVIEEIKAEAEKPIVPSRSVKVKLSQYLDVTYPGTGWIYIGETEKTPIFNYFGRKLGTGNTTFALRAKKAGKTLLHFYKNDALTGEYIDDYLEVEVLSARSAGRVKAPSYADIIPAKPQRRIDRANEKAADEKAISEQKETDSPKEDSQKKIAQTQQEKSTENKTPAQKGTDQKVPEQKTPAESAKSAGSESMAASEKSSAPATTAPAASTAPVTATAATQISAAVPESNIKTVIQNTDSTAESSKETREPAVESAKNQPDSETAEKAPDAQAFNYTSVSSQSAPVEESPILSEPVVIVEDSSVAADESVLEKAKKDFEEKNYELALTEAQQYYNTASTRLDEALYLLGQIWESNSSVKNIRSAVDSYDTLVKLYPASKYWKKAKNRSIYLKRFYIDIR